MVINSILMITFCGDKTRFGCNDVCLEGGGDFQGI
jgi:hypothetical protein